MPPGMDTHPAALEETAIRPSSRRMRFVPHRILRHWVIRDGAAIPLSVRSGLIHFAER